MSLPLRVLSEKDIPIFILLWRVIIHTVGIKSHALTRLN